MNLKPISNRKLTLLRKLNQKKYRWKEQLFFVEGARGVEQVVENGSLNVSELFFDESKQYWQQERWQQIIEKTGGSTVDSNDFREVTDTDNPQGVLALCEMPGEADADELARQNGLIIATDAIQDPGNLGTIIRTASWFGVRGILSGKGTVDLFHPKVVRSTAGSTGAMPYRNAELTNDLSFYESRGWKILLLDAGDESVSLKEISKSEKMMIVVGNEANGIDGALAAENRSKVEISSPRKNQHVESLNAAIAASVALYELS